MFCTYTQCTSAPYPQCSNVVGSTMFCRCTAAPYPQAPQLPHSFTFIPRHTPATSCTCSRMHQKRYMIHDYMMHDIRIHEYPIHNTKKTTRIHNTQKKTHGRDCACPSYMHQAPKKIHMYLLKNTFNSSNNKHKKDTCVVSIVCKTSLFYSWWDFGKFPIQHKYPCHCHTIPIAPSAKKRNTWNFSHTKKDICSWADKFSKFGPFYVCPEK